MEKKWTFFRETVPGSNLHGHAWINAPIYSAFEINSACEKVGMHVTDECWPQNLHNFFHQVYSYAWQNEGTGLSVGVIKFIQCIIIETVQVDQLTGKTCKVIP